MDKFDRAVLQEREVNPEIVSNSDIQADIEEGEATEPTIHIKDRRFSAAQESDDTVAEPQKPSYVEELERQVAEKDSRLQATLTQYKDALDDFENAKARIRRDVGKDIEAGKRAILSDLLDVVDNLERAILAAQGQSEASALFEGVKMVRDQFLLKLQGFGVRRVEALGALFDPSRFEAVSIVPVPDATQDGKVVGIVRDSYLIGDDTLRYGMVAVGKGPSENESCPEQVQA